MASTSTMDQTAPPRPSTPQRLGWSAGPSPPLLSPRASGPVSRPSHTTASSGCGSSAATRRPLASSCGRAAGRTAPAPPHPDGQQRERDLGAEPAAYPRTGRRRRRGRVCDLRRDERGVRAPVPRAGQAGVAGRVEVRVARRPARTRRGARCGDRRVAPAGSDRHRAQAKGRGCGGPPGPPTGRPGMASRSSVRPVLEGCRGHRPSSRLVGRLRSASGGSLASVTAA
jgi:hypothetical protein